MDHVFAQDDAACGLTFLEGTAIQHYAARQGQAGLVELWDVETTEAPSASAPFEPWNEDENGTDALEALCQRLAGQIRHWLDTREFLESQDRPIRAGDILILVRRREPFTAPMIRALKRAEIPVAGADRMRLLEQLAVQDLMALADVLLMPEDDLALAVVLKSPLFGLDETALFDLAHGRDGSLWTALQARRKRSAVMLKPPRRYARCWARPTCCRHTSFSPRFSARGFLAHAQAHALADRARGGRSDRRVSGCRARRMSATRRHPCKVSSPPCATRTSTSNATWIKTATKCGS